jgi:hypothetical protein
LNSDGREKLRQDEWLISAILREISQLERMGEAGRKATGSGKYRFSYEKSLEIFTLDRRPGRAAEKYNGFTLEAPAHEDNQRQQ